MQENDLWVVIQISMRVFNNQVVTMSRIIAKNFNITTFKLDFLTIIILTLINRSRTTRSTLSNHFQPLDNLLCWRSLQTQIKRSSSFKQARQISIIAHFIQTTIVILETIDNKDHLNVLIKSRWKIKRTLKTSTKEALIFITCRNQMIRCRLKQKLQRMRITTHIIVTSIN